MSPIGSGPSGRYHDDGDHDSEKRRWADLSVTRWDMPTYGERQWERHQYKSERMDRPSSPLPENDVQFTSRQLAGIEALLAIAAPEAAMIPFSGTTVHLRYTGGFERQNRGEPGRQLPDKSLDLTARVRGLWRSVHSDPMLRNSLYLILNSGVQAALGFAFWIVTGRFFKTESVGQASSLISAATLISFVGLLGLNTAFVRFLPISRHRSRLITAGLLLVGACSSCIAIVYIILMPLVSKPISFVAHSVPLAIGFILLTVGGGINVLTDSVFIAAGRARYNAFVDGIVGGVAKIVLIMIFIGGGAYGIFGAATGGFMAAALASLLLMTKVLGWRPVMHEFSQVLKPILRFSSMNYVGNILTLLPTLVVPLIVINRIGASATAYYYVSYQLASLLYSASYAVEQAFLAEGAQGSISKAVLVRSARILLALCVPAFIIVFLFAHQILAAFGSSYGQNAGSSLIPLTVAVFPIAAYNWSLTVLRLSNRLRAIVWSNATYAVAIIGLATLLAPHGLGAVAVAWPIGATMGALVAIASAARSLRTSRSAHPLRLHTRD